MIIFGSNETKRYFETAYKFIASYQNLGEEFIISAKVHMDESTPHMHLVFIPVVHKLDKKSGKTIDKIACSEYWKGKDSYKKLQNNFYSYVTKAGFDLERGNSKVNEHIPIDKLKIVTSYQLENYTKVSQNKEKELQTNDINQIKPHYKKIILKFNKLVEQYEKIQKTLNDMMFNQEKIEFENHLLNKKIIQQDREKEKLVNESNELKTQIERMYQYTSILTNFPIDRLKRLTSDFINRLK